MRHSEAADRRLTDFINWAQRRLEEVGPARRRAWLMLIDALVNQRAAIRLDAGRVGV